MGEDVMVGSYRFGWIFVYVLHFEFEFEMAVD